jgi:hypothetical protein
MNLKIPIFLSFSSKLVLSPAEEAKWKVVN